MSQLASANIQHPDPQHSELDALSNYNTILVEIYPTLVSQILASYKSDPWWAQLQIQILANNNLGADALTLPFVVSFTPPADSNSYLPPRSDGNKDFPLSSINVREILERSLAPDKSKLLYYINRLTNIF